MTFDEIYAQVARLIEQNPNKFNTSELISADLNITGDSPGVIGATIKNGKAHVKKGTTGKPDAVVTVSSKDLSSMLEGKLKPIFALVTRKIKVTGDYDKLMQIMKTMKK